MIQHAKGQGCQQDHPLRLHSQQADPPAEQG